VSEELMNDFLMDFCVLTMYVVKKRIHQASEVELSILLQKKVDLIFFIRQTLGNLNAELVKRKIKNQDAETVFIIQTKTKMLPLR
jgi:hypothetical protein